MEPLISGHLPKIGRWLEYPAIKYGAKNCISPAIQSSLTSISSTPFNPKTIIIHLPLPFLLLYLFFPWLPQFLPSSTDSSSDKVGINLEIQRFLNQSREFGH
ncbi:hypothetical protein SDJN03_10279, partial [Cucurbita argyrosperma subsp. sororia]